MRRAIVIVIVIVALAGARTAGAYPQFQFSSDTDRCSVCHLAPAGGGLLSEWGRDELGDTLSRGGDGRLLHGLDPPAWLTLGGDVRIAALANDTGTADGAAVAVFPMQLEAAARAGTAALSATVVIGLRGAARTAAGRTDGDDASILRGAAMFSREHFVSYQDDDRRWIVRAGRFAAPFGLRLVDHTAYIRRFLGYGLYEETYGLGVSRLGERDELHLTAFTSDPIQWQVARAFGAAALYERRSAGLALRGSARITVAARESRALGGVSATWWLAGPAIVVLAEIDGGWQAFTDADAGRAIATGYLGPTWFPTRGVSVTVAAEAHADEVRLPAANRYAASTAIGVLPWAHVELVASARYQWVGTQDHAATAMFQLHYFP